MEQKTFTVRIPTLSAIRIQSLFLVLLIVFALIQTAELFAIQRASAAMKVGASAPVAAPASADANGLPTMVGGC